MHGQSQIKCFGFLLVLSFAFVACRQKGRDSYVPPVALLAQTSGGSAVVLPLPQAILNEDVNSLGYPRFSLKNGKYEIFTEGVLLHSDQEKFDKEMKLLMSAKMPQKFIGSASAQAADGTGVFIGGRVALAKGELRFDGYLEPTAVQATSALLIVLVDEFTNQLDENGDMVAPATRLYTKATGVVQGNYVDLYFDDGGDILHLNGYFDQEMLSGTLGFTNKTKANGKSKGAQRVDVAQFQIPTCRFFECPR